MVDNNKNNETALSMISARSLQITDTHNQSAIPRHPMVRSYMRYSGPADLIAKDISIAILATHFKYQSKLSGYHSRSGLVRPSARTFGSPFPLIKSLLLIAVLINLIKILKKKPQPKLYQQTFSP